MSSTNKMCNNSFTSNLDDFPGFYTIFNMFYIWSFLPTALVEIYCREQVFVSTKLALVTATFPEPSDPSGHCSFSNLFLCYSFILTQSVQQQQHRTCNFNCTRTQSRLTPPSEIFPVHVGQKGKNK